MSNSCVAPKKRYVFLDGCRGVAAICVMLFHSSQIFGIYTFQSAYFAVDFFFMLSGYVLYKAYYDRPRINLEQFLLLRIVRLYPNFLFGLIFGSIILYFMSTMGYSNFSPNQILSSFFINIVYIPYFNHQIIINHFHLCSFYQSHPSWSLFFEMAASAIFIPIARKTTNYIGIVAVFALAFTLWIGFFDDLGRGRIGLTFAGGAFSETFIGGFPRVFFNFVVGILLARIPSSSREWRKPQIISVILLCLLVAWFIVPDFATGKSIYYLMSILVIFPLLIFYGSGLEIEDSLIGTMSNFLGWLSYPLYCLHFPVTRLVQMLIVIGAIKPDSAILASTAISIILSVIICKFADEPLRKYFSRIISRL